MRQACPSVRLSVCRQIAKTRFSQKLSNLEIWCLLMTYRKLCNWAFQRTHYWIPKIAILKIDMTSFFSAEYGPIWIKFQRLAWMQNDMSTVVMWSKSKSHVEFQYGGRLGEFNGMSSPSHVSHCRVLPLCEYTFTISERHVILQGVRIPSAILKIVFRHILFCFVLNAF